MECIYYKNKSDLTWKGREHIFPAGLGGIKKLELFVEVLKKGEKRIIHKVDDKIIDKEIIVGYAENTIYVATNPRNSMEDDLIKTIMKEAGDKYNGNSQMHFGENHVKVQNNLSETMDDYRAFGKIAFNVLADIKGKKYVLDSAFDKFRDWVLGGEDDDYSQFLPVLTKIPSMEKILPVDCHWCVFINMYGDLYGMVGIYNVYKRGMLLAKNKGSDFSIADGMICDWKNEKEYRMSDYVIEFCKQKNSLV